MFGNIAFDSINTSRNIYAVNNRIVISIFFNNVIIEKSISFRCRCCRQTKNCCTLKIVQNRLPFAINRAVALINDDKLKIIRRQFQIIAQRDNSLITVVVFERKEFFIFLIFVIISNCLTGQNSKQFLYCRNYYISANVVFVFQSVDLIQRTHRLLIFCTVKQAEFCFCLTSEIISVNKEQDPFSRCVIE